MLNYQQQQIVFYFNKIISDELIPDLKKLKDIKEYPGKAILESLNQNIDFLRIELFRKLFTFDPYLVNIEVDKEKIKILLNEVNS